MVEALNHLLDSILYPTKYLIQYRDIFSGILLEIPPMIPSRMCSTDSFKNFVWISSQSPLEERTWISPRILEENLPRWRNSSRGYFTNFAEVSFRNPPTDFRHSDTKTGLKNYFRNFFRSFFKKSLKNCSEHVLLGLKHPPEVKKIQFQKSLFGFLPKWLHRFLRKSMNFCTQKLLIFNPLPQWHTFCLFTSDNCVLVVTPSWTPYHL